MAVRLAEPGPRGLLSVALNQDCTCSIAAGFRGLSIFNLETGIKCLELDVGSASLASMLYCTSLIAYCGAGEQPTATPRRLVLYNTHTCSTIATLSFPTSVLGLQLNKKYFCVVLESSVQLYSLEGLQHLSTMTTPPNPKGLAALSLDEAKTYLALPASQLRGFVAVHDITHAGQGSVLEIKAHHTPLAVMQWSGDSTMLATASLKGTIVRVFQMPQGDKVYSLRRGTSPARITSMAFSLPSQQPPLLFVASDHSSIHVFRLDKAGVKHAAAAAVAKTMLSSVIPRNPPRKGAKVMKIKLPCKKGTALACGVRPSTQDAANEDGTVRVAVVSTEGILYIYAISDLMGHPTASLEGESVVN